MNLTELSGTVPCHCAAPHRTVLVALTGGPGAGKTAVLEVLKRHLCKHLVVLPEAASILFSGGFPRETSGAGRRAGQRAIFGVQRELERLAVEHGGFAVALCDRGTVDGLAYWPESEAAFWEDVGSSRAAEHARYAAVIHLRSPGADQGYEVTSNPVRTESALEAARIDACIHLAWEGHARRTTIESADTFLEKLTRAIDAIRAEMPACCRGHLPSGGAEGDPDCEHTGSPETPGHGPEGG